jgi:hypothetical protein
VASGAHRERFATLVRFLRDRAADPVPTESEDWAAARERFGTVSREEIRGARREAYGAGAINRGRPIR